MLMTQEKMGEELKGIANIKNEIEELDGKKNKFIKQIKTIEVDLKNIRCKKKMLDDRLIEKCDKLFNDTYKSLPYE